MDTAPHAGSTGAKPRVRARRQMRRPDLIHAAIEIACARGRGALTTQGIAAAAGVTQSSFYTYFKNVDECVQIIADDLTERAQQVELQLQQAGVFKINENEDEQVRVERVKLALRLWTQDPLLTTLMLRFRSDPSSLGAAARDAQNRLVEAIIEGLLDFAIKRRGTFRMERAEVLATLLVGSFMHALELLANNAVQDAELVAVTLANAHRSFVKSELRNAALLQPSPATVVSDSLVLTHAPQALLDGQGANAAGMGRR